MHESDEAAGGQKGLLEGLLEEVHYKDFQQFGVESECMQQMEFR